MSGSGHEPCRVTPLFPIVLFFKKNDPGRSPPVLKKERGDFFYSIRRDLVRKEQEPPFSFTALARRERELLHQLRISGSAVGEVNVEASEAWKGLSRELYSQFDQRLQQLREQLLNKVASL